MAVLLHSIWIYKFESNYHNKTQLYATFTCGTYCMIRAPFLRHAHSFTAIQHLPVLQC